MATKPKRLNPATGGINTNFALTINPDRSAGADHKTEAKIDTAFRKIALDAFSEVILMSPVDTGRFRGNWQVSIGSIPNGTVEIDDKAGTATIGKVQAETMGLRGGQTIYLINNLPYAIPLEYGSSQQAPSGMVRLTAQRWKPIVEAVGRQLSWE